MEAEGSLITFWNSSNPISPAPHASPIHSTTRSASFLPWQRTGQDAYQARAHFKTQEKTYNRLALHWKAHARPARKQKRSKSSAQKPPFTSLQKTSTPRAKAAPQAVPRPEHSRRASQGSAPLPLCTAGRQEPAVALPGRYLPINKSLRSPCSPIPSLGTWQASFPFGLVLQG